MVEVHRKGSHKSHISLSRCPPSSLSTSVHQVERDISSQPSIKISSHLHPFRSLLRAIHLDLSTKSSIQISPYTHPIPISTHCYDPSRYLLIAIHPDLYSQLSMEISLQCHPSRSLLSAIPPDLLTAFHPDLTPWPSILIYPPQSHPFRTFLIAIYPGFNSQPSIKACPHGYLS
jgi:hypothetical protein